MAGDTTIWFLLLHALLLASVVVLTNASEADTLIEFRDSLSNHSSLDNWDTSVGLCNWEGLLCHDDGTFYGLQLENMGLAGKIDVEKLAELRNLLTVSFKDNSFDGAMPDFNALPTLRGLFLSNNNFSGSIPNDAFAKMKKLRRVHLANNKFTGQIPNSLVGIPKLVEVQLQDNQFEGEIPNFKQRDLEVNVANNKLQGPIPSSLSGQPSSSFLGNPNLCGQPLEACKSTKKKKSIPKLTIILIIVGIVVLASLIITASLFQARRDRSPRTQKTKLGRPTSSKFPKKDVAYNYKTTEKESVESLKSEEQAENYKRSDNGKLYFVRNDRERFELQDLLRASAEVLGSGSFGSSYKAILLNGSAMVVKRYRHMSHVGKEEFYEHMRRLGSLSHPNLLPLVAFYYRKEEKLLLTDFIQNGSLASHLHGKRGPNQPGLEWPKRLTIVKGVAKGLAYLHKQLSALTLPHGHLKSTNVLLDDTLEPLLADYALVPVVNKEHVQQHMVAYKSPEFTQHELTNKKTDVWSLGILILEILTGKFPANYPMKQDKASSSNNNGADIATWVNSVVREEWTGEVFDKDMRGTKNGEGEMLKLLKIGMCCCEWNVETRWDLMIAVEKIEELKERDSDDEYSSYASEGDVYSSRAMTEDEFSFSVTG